MGSACFRLSRFFFILRRKILFPPISKAVRNVSVSISAPCSVPSYLLYIFSKHVPVTYKHILKVLRKMKTCRFAIVENVQNSGQSDMAFVKYFEYGRVFKRAEITEECKTLQSPKLTSTFQNKTRILSPLLCSTDKTLVQNKLNLCLSPDSRTFASCQYSKAP